MKTSPVSIRLVPDVKAALAKAAKADSRSLSSMAEKVLTDYLRKHGFLKER